MSTRIALVMAVILGIVAAVAVRAWVETERTERLKRSEPVAIIAAAETIKKGEPLTQNLYTTKLVAKNMVRADMITATEAGIFLKKILNKDVEKGWTISRNDLVTGLEKETLNRSLIAEGKRAVTIKVDQISGVAGLIRPGDHVDIIGIFDVRKEGSSGRNAAGTAVGGDQRDTVTRSLMESVKILAIDNRIMDYSQKQLASRPYRTVTVEVDPVNAACLIDAQNNGKLHLMLRARRDVTKALPENTDIRWENIQSR